VQPCPPPLDVFCDGADYWLADGFHRYHAATAIGMTEIVCTVEDGDLDDAVWFSLQANRSNGVRRTQQDVRNAVQRALMHPNSAGRTDRQVADYVGCSPTTVGTVRRKLEAVVQIGQQNKRVGRDGKTYRADASRGKAAEPPAEPAAEKHEVDPNQIDLEDYPGVKQPQPINYIDRSNDWIHNEVKAVAAASSSVTNIKPAEREVTRGGVTYTMKTVAKWRAELVTGQVPSESGQPGAVPQEQCRI
jgi:hypothetical protein